MSKSKFLILLLQFSIYLNGFSQKLPVVKAGNLAVDIREGEELRKSSWQIESSAKPDIYEVYMTGKSKPVTFISDQDSISFDVKPGNSYTFIFLVNGKDSAFTEIKGIHEVPRVRFTKHYINSHTGKTFVEIPPVYELLNIVFALTKKGMQDNGLIVKSTPYYSEMLKWFDQYRQEPIVEKMDAELSTDGDSYHALKMDAYAFDFSEKGKIEQSKVYNRIGWAKINFLKPFITDLQDFATKTKFRDFYRNHQSFYNGQVITYRDSIGVPEMQKWLTVNFPSTKYDSFKIIFSPLVGNNQSANWFEDNGFREAQAHVNFPYRGSTAIKLYSKEALLVRDGNIVFTELNHSFINPEGEKSQFNDGIMAAFANMDTWNDKDKPAKYYNNAYLSFNEYMNWGLVSLRYVDLAPKDELDKLILANEK